MQRCELKSDVLVLINNNTASKDLRPIHNNNDTYKDNHNDTYIIFRTSGLYRSVYSKRVLVFHLKYASLFTAGWILIGSSTG